MYYLFYAHFIMMKKKLSIISESYIYQFDSIKIGNECICNEFYISKNIKYNDYYKDQIKKIITSLSHITNIIDKIDNDYFFSEIFYYMYSNHKIKININKSKTSESNFIFTNTYLYSSIYNNHKVVSNDIIKKYGDTIASTHYSNTKYYESISSYIYYRFKKR